jgi:hypothetical protein
VTDEPRRSRRGWPDPEPPAPDGDAVVPAHKHSRVPVGIAYVAIVLLLVTDVLLVIGWMDFNDYVHGKGQQRDQENARLNQRINDAICDLLDQLPEGPLLDRPREKYGCGPGIPFDQLPPDIQQQLTPAPAPAATTAPAPTATPDEPSPDAPTSAARPPAPDTPEPLPGGADGPMTPSEPPPLSPPSQARELVCGLLPVCPEESP